MAARLQHREPLGRLQIGAVLQRSRQGLFDFFEFQLDSGHMQPQDRVFLTHSLVHGLIVGIPTTKQRGGLLDLLDKLVDLVP